LLNNIITFGITSLPIFFDKRNGGFTKAKPEQNKKLSFSLINERNKHLLSGICVLSPTTGSSLFY